MRPLAKIIAISLRAVVRGYQLLISPILAGSCRYHPTCSGYALEALEKHGPASGSWLAVKRIFRCHPWGGHGFDPVPEPRSHTHESRSHAGACGAHPDKRILARK